MSENKNQQELKAILKKYLNNDTSVEEREAINAWYQSAGNENEEVPGLADPQAKAELAGNIKMYLRHEIYGRKNYWFKPFYLKYAAACMLICSMAGAGYLYINSQHKAAKKEIVLLSGAAAQKQLSLPDGSEVLLNVGSRLTISKDFGDDTRNVTLVGEAFFKVAKDSSRPFIIRSGILKTRVVGTSFNINAYPDLGRIKVSVMTGRVKVSGMMAGHEKLLAAGMTKGETLSYDKTTRLTELRNEDTELISSWRNNKLYIDNATIEDIARQLERYYHIRVVHTGSNNSKDRYTIRFNNESMNGVLSILSILTKRKFIYQTHQITIK